MTRSLSVLIIGVAIAVGISACSQGSEIRRTEGPQPVPLMPQSSQIVASMRHTGSTGVTLSYHVPGTGIAILGAPWPYYEGTFDFHAGTGSLRLHNTSHMPSVSWILNPSGSILTTSAPQPFTTAGTSLGSAVTPSGFPVSGSATGGNTDGGLFNEKISFARVAAAGALDPVETYEAVVVNPAFWLDLLRSSSSPLGKGVRSVVNGENTYSYDVVFNLKNATSTVSRSQYAVIQWLIGYFGTSYLPGELWLSKTRKLVKMRLIRALRSQGPPRNTSQFPEPTFHPSLTLALLGPAHTKASSPTGGSTTILGQVKGIRPRCVPAGHSGLSAAISAYAGQHITGSINAAGCDVGVYVGSGTAGVVISNATITGANAHAIMVVDTSGTVVEDNTVNDAFGNIIDLTLLLLNKAIMLVGTVDARVIGNYGFDTIGIVDNGAVDAGAVNPGTPSPASGNVIEGNHAWGWLHRIDCWVVLAARNHGEGVIGNTISDNKVPGNIVIATDATDTTASRNVVNGNTVVNATIAGIAIRSTGIGGIIKGNIITGNNLSGDGSRTACKLSRSAGTTTSRPATTILNAEAQSAGIAIIGADSTVLDTLIHGNIITNEQVGIWVANATGTVLSGNRVSVFHGGVPIEHLARPSCRS
ncbi:MAG: right-handed parallel beta-helix repeat-containing protein [Acidimicrobiales bacterium]